jgi:hypothetical protein
MFERFRMAEAEERRATQRITIRQALVGLAVLAVLYGGFLAYVFACAPMPAGVK